MLLLLIWLLPLIFRAVKRAEHRRLAGPESGPCLSAASLGRVPRRPRSAGARCGAAAPDRVRRKRFWFLLPRQKELAQSAKAFFLRRQQVRRRCGPDWNDLLATICGNNSRNALRNTPSTTNLIIGCGCSSKFRNGLRCKSPTLFNQIHELL